MSSKAEKSHMDKVANAGCIVCRLHLGVFSPATCHHVLKNGRWDDMRVLGLCGAHHQTGGRGVALHPYWKLWEELYGTQEELLNQEIL